MKILSAIPILFILILLLAFGSCSHDVQHSGIENFSENHSNVELTVHLLPSDTFIDDYQYKNAEYYFRDLGECLSGYNLLERSIVIVEYDEDVYIEAKEFCFENMDLLYDNTHEYNGYTFVENVELSKGKNEFKNGKSRYPKKFQMFAYNDNKQCLIFMAFNSSDKYLDKANELLPEWGDFLEEFYSEYYNFNV